MDRLFGATCVLNSEKVLASRLVYSFFHSLLAIIIPYSRNEEMSEMFDNVFTIKIEHHESRNVAPRHTILLSPIRSRGLLFLWYSNSSNLSLQLEQVPRVCLVCHGFLYPCGSAEFLLLDSMLCRSFDFFRAVLLKMSSRPWGAMICGTFVVFLALKSSFDHPASLVQWSFTFWISRRFRDRMDALSL